MGKINVLSLFGGIETGALVLKQLKIDVGYYFSSEVDPESVANSNYNFDNIIQIGDVKEVSYKDGVLYWNDGELKVKIDLVIGGSPCQGFSIAGKQLNFEDPRSKLFFEFARLIEEISPDSFLLENVRMRKDIASAIDEIMGVKHFEINSASFYAQSRHRYYWTNLIKDEEGLSTLKDFILSYDDIQLRDVVSDNYEQYLVVKQSKLDKFFEKYSNKNGIECLGIIPENIKPYGNYFPRERVFGVNGKSRAICTIFSQMAYYKINNIVRRLSINECELLQGLPVDFTKYGKYSTGIKEIKHEKRFWMVGNGWSVEPIKLILSFLPEKYFL